MSKFKVGDEVRIISQEHSCSLQDVGDSFIVGEVFNDGEGGKLWYRKDKGNAYGVREDCLEPVSQKKQPISNCIITNITSPEQHKRVQEKLFGMGYEWFNGENINEEATEYNNCLGKDNGKMEYVSGENNPAQWYRNNNYIIDKEIPASEFLGEEEVSKFNQGDCIIRIKEYYKNNFVELNNPTTEPCVSKGNKIMSLITNALKSKEDKALEEFNLGSEKELNSNGRDEFIQHLYQVLTVERKSFLAKVVEAYKETKNK